MRLTILLMAFVLIPTVWAISDVLDADSLELEAQWSGKLTSEAEPGARFTSLEARVSIIPSGPYATEPRSVEEDGSIVFEWTDLRPTYRYAIHANLTTRTMGGLSQSEPWPTGTRGLLETDLIDYNDPAIRAFAAGIAQGETDTLRLAVRAADAVRQRIEYNLSTIAIEATLPASEVLERGEGVCDEISVLYIAVMRALGVPARYVSGYAYTDIFDPEGSWEAHSWTEVFIAGEWVPFDLTYGEYLYLSAAHLPLRRSEDARAQRISYTWYAQNVDISAQQIETDIRITDQGPGVRFGALEARFVHDDIGPEWNELEISVRNERDSFIAPVVLIGRTQGLELPSEETIIVPPRSERSVRVPVRIVEPLKDRYEYTFPASVDARGFERVTTQFRATSRGPSVPEPLSIDERDYHPDLSIRCSDVLGLPESTSETTCTITNTGNRNLVVRVCGDSCTLTEVLISDTVNTRVPIELSEGIEERTITISGDVTSTTTITATGREPARVELVADADGRSIDVHVDSDHPINGSLQARIGSYTTDSMRFDVPSTVFGLRGTVTISYTYVDVDGEHTIETNALVEQTIIELIASRLEAWISSLY